MSNYSRKIVSFTLVQPPRSAVDTFHSIAESGAKKELTPDNSTIYRSFFHLMQIITEQLGYVGRVIQVSPQDDGSICGRAAYEVFTPTAKAAWIENLHQHFQSHPKYVELMERAQRSRDSFGMVSRAMMEEQKEIEPPLTDPVVRLLLATWLTYKLDSNSRIGSMPPADQIGVCRKVLEPILTDHVLGAGLLFEDLIPQIIAYDPLNMAILKMTTNRKTLIIPKGRYEEEMPLSGAAMDAYRSFQYHPDSHFFEEDPQISESSDPLSLVLDRYTFGYSSGRIDPHFGGVEQIAMLPIRFNDGGLPDFLVELRNWPPTGFGFDNFEELAENLARYISAQLKPYSQRDLPKKQARFTFVPPGGREPIGTYTEKRRHHNPLIKLPGGFNAEVIKDLSKLKEVEDELLAALCAIHDISYAPNPDVIYRKLHAPEGSIAIVRDRSGKIHGFVSVQVMRSSNGRRREKPVLLLSGTFLSLEAQSHGILQFLNNRFCKKFFWRHLTGIDVACRTYHQHVLGAAYENNGGDILPSKPHIWIYRAVQIWMDYNTICENAPDQHPIVKKRMLELAIRNRDGIMSWIEEPGSVREIKFLIFQEIVNALNHIKLRPPIKALFNQFRQLTATDIASKAKLFDDFMERLKLHYDLHHHIPQRDLDKWVRIYKLIDGNDPTLSETRSVRTEFSLPHVFPARPDYDRVRQLHQSATVQAAPLLLRPDEGDGWLVVGRYDFGVLLRMTFWRPIKRFWRQLGRRDLPPPVSRAPHSVHTPALTVEGTGATRAQNGRIGSDADNGRPSLQLDHKEIDADEVAVPNDANLDRLTTAESSVV